MSVFQLIDFILQALKEPDRVTAIHLNMMELERYRQSGLEQAFTIPAPCQEGVIIATGILINDTIQFYLRQRRRAHNNVVFQGGALAGLMILVMMR